MGRLKLRISFSENHIQLVRVIDFTDHKRSIGISDPTQSAYYGLVTQTSNETYKSCLLANKHSLSLRDPKKFHLSLMTRIGYQWQ